MTDQTRSGVLVMLGNKKEKPKFTALYFRAANRDCSARFMSLLRWPALGSFRLISFLTSRMTQGVGLLDCYANFTPRASSRRILQTGTTNRYMSVFDPAKPRWFAIGRGITACIATRGSRRCMIDLVLPRIRLGRRGSRCRTAAVIHSR